MRALHQFVPTFEPGAVGGHILELQRLAREALGVEARVFAEHVHASMAGRAHRHRDYGRKVTASCDDVLVYHLAIGSHVADFVRERREPLVVDHHNVTPAELYERWDPGAAWGCSWGRAQLPELAERATLGIGDSTYNEAELRAAGYRSTAVAPILVDLEELSGEVDEEAASVLAGAKDGGGADWLFVSRIAPGKCQHDLVKAFAAYRRLYDSSARLHLVGGVSSPAYAGAVERLAGALGVAGAVRLTGPVPRGVLAAHYATADVFVCLSEHEGFAIPVLEAMASGVPVIAFASSAVPDTAGGAAVLLPAKAPATVAAAAHRVASDPALRAALVEAGRARAGDFSLERTRATWLEVLGRLEEAAA